MAITQEDLAAIRWVQWEYVNCRSKSCWKCQANGPGAHGPYAYGYWKEGRRRRKVYIGRELPEALRDLVGKPKAPAFVRELPPVPKNEPRSAARVTPPPETNAAVYLAEAEAVLRLAGDYTREKLRKRLWNLLDSPTLTSGVRNELVTSARIICRAKHWQPFASMGRRAVKSSPELQ